MVEGAAEADAAVERVRRHHRGLIYKGEPQLKAHVMARALFKREGYERLTKDCIQCALTINNNNIALYSASPSHGTQCTVPQ